MKIISLVLMMAASLVVLLGCATNQSPEKIAQQAEINRTVPICIDEKDCNEKWEAAQLWVVHNAGFKIQLSTNVLIETYNATNSTVNIAVRVTKEPIGSGKYKFLASVWCDNMFGCSPDTMDAVLDFNRTVGSAGQSIQTNPSSNKLRFGVSFSEVTPAIASIVGRPDLKGVVIAVVESGSVADKAGVKVGDILIEYDGKVITSPQELQTDVTNTLAGESKTIKILRALKEFTITASF